MPTPREFDAAAEVSQAVRAVVDTIDGVMEGLDLAPQDVFAFMASVQAAITLKTNLFLLEGIHTVTEVVSDHAHDYEDPRHGVAVPTSKAKMEGHLLGQQFDGAAEEEDPHG